MTGSDIFTGTLDLLILRALESGPRHGYAIGKWIRDGSQGALDVEEGVLYPALHRLEKRGWLVGGWGQTDTKRRAKFYRLTPEAVRVLKAETERWLVYAQAVTGLLEGSTP